MGSIAILPAIVATPPVPPSAPDVQNPAPQPQQDTSGQSAAPSDSSSNRSGNTQAGNAQSGSNADRASGSANNSNNNTSSASQGNAASQGNTKQFHFRKLLAAHLGAQASAGNSDSSQASGAGGQGNVPAEPSTQGSGAQDTSGGNIITDAVGKLLVMVQVQLQGVNITPGAAGAAGGIGASGDVSTQTTDLSSQANDLLQALQQILQQLLQAATAAAQAAPGQPAAAQDNSAGAPQQGSGQGNTQDNTGDNPLAEMLAQLLAVLNQIQQQPDGQTLSFNLDSLAITNNGQSSNAADLLAQLAQSLDNNLNPAQSNNTDTTTADASAQGAINIPSVFDNLINSFVQQAGKGSAAQNQAQGNNSNNAPSDTPSQNITDQLQSLFTNIVNVLSSDKAYGAATPDIFSSGKDNSGNNNNTDASLQQNTQVAPPVINSAPQVATTDFVKFTSVTQTPPSSVSDQVIVQIKSAAATGANIIRIQLEPADLGRVEVRMVTGADGNTSISVTADNRQTLAMLQSEAQSLQSALRDVGLKTNMGGLSFNLGGQGQNTSNFNGNHGGYTQVPAVDNLEDVDANLGTTLAYYQVTVRDGLDIRV